MKRLASLATAAGVVAGAVLAAAPALAVTNPAANPRPITVKGDDGRTYTDGQDTLPGYDDVECSYIPGAWYDFGANRVHYADGQSIGWTEWDRVPGYASWKAKQSAARTAPAPAQDGGTTAGSASKPGASKPGASKPGASKAAAPRSGGSGAGTSTASTTKAAASAPAAGSAGADLGTASPAPITGAGASVSGAEPKSTAVERDRATDAGEAETQEGAAPSSSGETGAPAENTDLVDARLVGGERPDAAAEAGGSAAGLLILGGLGVGAVALLGGWSLVGRRAKGVRP